jgi:hypothetical protein
MCYVEEEAPPHGAVLCETTKSVGRWPKGGLAENR